MRYMQSWTGTFFTKSSLQEIGLRVNLGHRGSICPSPSGHVDDFIVCDTSGIHRITVTFCGCVHSDGNRKYPHYMQLLQVGWYPMSHARPQSACTFAVLDFFLDLTHQAKTNLYDFHRTLQRQSDAWKLLNIPVYFLIHVTTQF